MIVPTIKCAIGAAESLNYIKYIMMMDVVQHYVTWLICDPEISTKNIEDCMQEDKKNVN